MLRPGNPIKPAAAPRNYLVAQRNPGNSRPAAAGRTPARGGGCVGADFGMLESVQEMFMMQCNQIFECMINMDVHDVEVSQMFNQAMTVRGRLGRLMGYPDRGAPTPAAMGGRTPAAARGMLSGSSTQAKSQGGGAGRPLTDVLKGYTLQENEAKQVLGIALQKKHKVSSIKEVVTFTSQETDGVHTVSLSGVGLAGSYEAFGENKKEAENRACLEAVMAEFPEVVRICHSQAPTVKPGGQRADVEQSRQEPKNRLCHFMQCLLDRTLEKNEILYTVEDAGGSFVATVQIPATEHNELQQFQGAMSSTKQEAEKSAAQQAVDALEELAQPLVEAKAERKRIKEQELAEERKRRKLEEAAAAS